MAFTLCCNSPLLAEVTEGAVVSECVEYTRQGQNIHLAVHTPFGLTRTHFGVLNDLNCPFTGDENILGWRIFPDFNKDQIAGDIRKLILPALYKREIPILKTFVHNTMHEPDALSPVKPSLLLMGRETSFGLLAAIVPDEFEIIGAYQESIAEDFLHSKSFSGILLDKESVAIEDIRFLRVLQMHPDLANIPVFMVGEFTPDEVILAQKQGVTIICPLHWPIDVLTKAVKNSVEFYEYTLKLKGELQNIQKQYHESKERIFSPLVQKLFMASLQTRLKINRQGLARGTTLVIDMELYPCHTPQSTISKDSEIHFNISKQILELMQHLSRAEDQIFAISENRIAMVLPGTIPDGAMAAGGRYKAILQSSRFRGSKKGNALNEEIGVYIQTHFIPLDAPFIAQPVRREQEPADMQEFHAV